MKDEAFVRRIGNKNVTGTKHEKYDLLIKDFQNKLEKTELWSCSSVIRGGYLLPRGTVLKGITVPRKLSVVTICDNSSLYFDNELFELPE
ncbi:hypothetical protein NPIL_702381 [Nephila pilipes]|uniref:Uncharacterized protein n=1 Tax=Nephila pilipes TaxID=299642 RepID=A0A8X6UM87_NEPPI|nr:hypothetical protein NPIL_702381 [Nephila pilipes]